MAKRTITVCDMHGSQDVRADETIEFTGTDGVKYSIDLCPDDVTKFRAVEKDLEVFQKTATALSRSPGKAGQRTRTNHDRQETAAIREWARAQGIDLGARGRIPVELRQKYRDEVGAEARHRWAGQPA